MIQKDLLIEANPISLDKQAMFHFLVPQKRLKYTDSMLNCTKQDVLSQSTGVLEDKQAISNVPHPAHPTPPLIGPNFSLYYSSTSRTVW